MSEELHPNAVLVKQLRAEEAKHSADIAQSEYLLAETKLRIATQTPVAQVVTVHKSSFWPWVAFFILALCALDYIGVIKHANITAAILR